MIIVLFLIFFLDNCQETCREYTRCDGAGEYVYYREGYCYCLNTNAQTIATARGWCEDELNFGPDSYVVSLQDQDEFDWFHSTVVTWTWIGLQHEANGGIYECDWDLCTWDDPLANTDDFRPGLVCDNNPATVRDFFYRNDVMVLMDYSSGSSADFMCKYKLFCNNIWAGDGGVCNGHGDCKTNDFCTCIGGYYGDDCEINECFGVKSDSNPCNGHGDCTEFDNCVCDGGWAGLNCTTELIGKCSDSSEQYDGYCYKIFDASRNFEDAETFCVDYDPEISSSHLVSIHSIGEETFIDTNIREINDEDNIWLGLRKIPEGDYVNCPPDFGYYWTDHTDDNYAFEDKVVTCGTSDECIAWTETTDDWDDVDCSLINTYNTTCKFKIPICLGLYSYDYENVCSGKGYCVADEDCQCVDGFFGDYCETWKCDGILNTEPGVCTGNGDCVSTDACDCLSGYSGEICNITSCNGIKQGENGICSYRGTCMKPDICKCDDGFAGNDCQYPRICQESGTVLNGYCWEKVIGFDSQQKGAEDECSEWDGRLPMGNLASIHTTEEYSLCETLRGGDDVWLGLKKSQDSTSCTNSGDASSYYWTDLTSDDWYFDEYGPLSCPDSTNWCMEFTDAGQMNDWDCADRGHLLPFICKRPIPFCDGHNATSLDVCSGKGICFDTELCLCFSQLDYLGQYCNITYCNYIMSNLTDFSCSGHGKCWPKDVCSCDEDYFGIDCEVNLCQGVLSNESSGYCSEHGDCVDLDTCSCDNGYFGEICNITTCDGKWNNVSGNGVCSDHGICTFFDECTCDDDDEYYGDDCEYPYCFGVPSTSVYPLACSGRGNCWLFDTCSCVEDFYGVNCNITTCDGEMSNDTLVVCSGHGVCWPKDFCECEPVPGQFLGDYCEADHPCTGASDHVYDGYCYKNFGKIGTESESEELCLKWTPIAHLLSIWSGLEDTFVETTLINDQIWLGLKKLFSDDEEKKYPCPGPGYSWEDGSSQAYARDIKNVECRGNGSCFVMNLDGDWEDTLCTNTSDYIESVCKYRIPVCGGVTGNYESACSFHGWCVSDDNCYCFTSEYDGLVCNETFCDSILSTDHENVCNGRGTCWPLDTCTCETDYFGTDCEVTTCHETFSNSTVCGGHGTCWPKDVCSCANEEGWYGNECFEFIPTNREAELFVNESHVFLPYIVPVDIAIEYRRLIEDGVVVTCDDRIPNFRDFLGEEDWPEADCRWDVNESYAGYTVGLLHTINYDSPIYDDVPDNQEHVYEFHVHLLTENRNVTVELIRRGEIVAPPRPDNDDDNEDIPVVGIVSGVVGGLAAGILAIIIAGGMCGCVLICCFLCCTLFILVVVTVLGACGVLLMLLCTGTTAVGGAVVGKEVHDEAMDEGVDNVTDAVKQRYEKGGGHSGGGGGLLDDEEMDLVGEEEEEFITDNLQEDVLRKDEEFEDEDGLDLGKIKDDDDVEGGVEGSTSDDSDSSDGGIGLMDETEEERQFRKEKERKDRQERKEAEEKEKEKVEKRRKKKEEAEEKRRMKAEERERKKQKIHETMEGKMNLVLDTKFSRKKKKLQKKKLKQVDKEFDKLERKEKRKEEKKEGSSLSLRNFERKGKKKRDKI